MRMHSSQPLKTLPSCKLVNHPRSASVSIDRPAVLPLRKVGSLASIPSVARQVDARFSDPPGAVRSVFLRVQPRYPLAVGIEESHILAIDLLALLGCRIGTRNVEIPVLHEVVICIAAARFSPARKPRVCDSAGRQSRVRITNAYGYWPQLPKRSPEETLTRTIWRRERNWGRTFST